MSLSVQAIDRKSDIDAFENLLEKLSQEYYDGKYHFLVKMLVKQNNTEIHDLLLELIHDIGFNYTKYPSLECFTLYSFEETHITKLESPERIENAKRLVGQINLLMEYLATGKVLHEDFRDHDEPHWYNSNLSHLLNELRARYLKYGELIV